MLFSKNSKTCVNAFKIFIMSFYLEAKGPKVQDLESFAKNKCCSLKILNLREYMVCSH